MGEFFPRQGKAAALRANWHFSFYFFFLLRDKANGCQLTDVQHFFFYFLKKKKKKKKHFWLLNHCKKRNNYNYFGVLFFWNLYLILGTFNNYS